jgi:hypothetical protein
MTLLSHHENQAYNTLNLSVPSIGIMFMGIKILDMLPSA